MNSDATIAQHELPQTRSSRGMPTLVACGVGCLVLVMTVGMQAPAASVGLRWKPAPRFRPPDIEIEPFTLDGAIPEPRPIDFWPSWATWSITGLVAFALLFLLVRWMRRRRAPRMTPGRVGADPGALSEAGAEILQSGLAAAIQILSADSERDLGNAVVQAWQGLEDAAAAAGLQRRPAETASEFTARILYRSRRSAEPIALLLSLYQRVRFGEHSPRSDEITAARHSLVVLMNLWRADFPERRPPRVSR